MHFVKNVEYVESYILMLTFEDGLVKRIDLSSHLDGPIFTKLKDLNYFKTVKLHLDLDTVYWDNGADFSPDFLYDHAQTVSGYKKAA